MNRTQTFVICLAFIALVVGISYGFFGPEERALTTQGLFECNGDGLQCPDGTVVGRTGPLCQFSECPGVMPVSSTSTGLTGIGVVSGRVLVSPTCPVERVPPEPGCEPRGYETTVYAVRSGTHIVAVETRTTKDGGFVMDLSPGSYVLRAESGKVFPVCVEKEIIVREGERVTHNIECDSGIR